MSKIDPKHISDLVTTDTELSAGLILKVDKVAGKGLSTEDYTTVEKSKLLGIATAATANDTDANLKARANHTGTQLASTISNFAATVITAVLTGFSTATSTAVIATDTILVGIGKLQAQINTINSIDLGALVRGTILTGISFATSTAILAGDTILVAFGKLQAQITSLSASKYDASNPNSYETTTQLNARDTDNRVRANHTGNETELTFSEGINPSAPVAGLTTYARQITGRNMLGQIGKSGVDYSFQPLIARNKVSLWQSNGNATSVTAIGNAFTANGTATTRNVATTNVFTWFRRMGYVSAGTSNSSCGLRTPSLQYGRGNVTGMGGFHFIARCGNSDASLVTNARFFAGLTTSTGNIGNVNPSTLLNIIGFGNDSSDTNMQVMHNDSTGTATKINLGASFPANTTNTDMYEFSLYCPPNASSIQYQVMNLTTNAVANGSISSDIPLNTQLLAMQLWRHNGGTAAAVGLDVVSLYMETDN